MPNPILSATDVQTAACRRTLPIITFTLPLTSQPDFGYVNLPKQWKDNTYINRFLGVISCTKEFILNHQYYPIAADTPLPQLPTGQR